MNHSILKDVPHLNRIYNRSRYIDRLYKCKSVGEVYSVLKHGIQNRFLDWNDIFHIYCNADRRILDEDIQVADWIMTESGFIVAQPSSISLSVFF
jgi:hypothetical protein